MHSEDTPSRQKPLIPIEAPLPILNAEDMGVPTRATPQSDIADLGKVYDYAVQAPVRAGVAEYAKSAKEGSMIPELRGLWGAAKQYFKKPETTPTWSEIGGIAGLSPLSFKDAAMQAGLPYDMYPDVSAADIGGFVGENAIDPLNLFGAGAAKAGTGLAMGAMKYSDDALKGAKKMGKQYPMAPEGTWYGEGTYKQAGGDLVDMTPDEFLSKSAPLKIDDMARENIDDLKQHIKDGGELDPLTLYEINTKSVKASDGRHRANAAKELGMDNVPVVSYVRGESKGPQMSMGDELIPEASKYRDVEEFKALSFDNILKDLRGVERDTEVTIPIKDVKIKWKDDLDNAEYFAKPDYDPNNAPPVEFTYDLKSKKYILDDGHHRYVSAKRNKKPLKGVIEQINGNMDELETAYQKEKGVSLTDIWNKAKGR